MTGAEAPARAEHLDDHVCADLVLRLVPNPERDAWLAHAAGCAVCTARLRAHAGAAERACADWRALSGATAAVVPPIVPTIVPLPRSSRARSWRNAAVLAAAAVVAIVLGLPWLTPRPVEGPGDAWLPAAGERVRTRSAAGDSDDPHLAAGLEAYAARDWVRADRELSVARTTGSNEQVRRLYLAQVRWTRGDAGSALALLRTLDWRWIPEPWRRAGVGLLARALRRQGDIAEADSIDRALRATPSSTPIVP